MDEKQIALSQEEPEQVKPLDLLYVVFFVGILLTFALYVCITMFLGAQTSISDSYWTEEEYLMPMESYNEAYYKNDSLRDLILRYDYGLFGKVNDNNVLVGRENFLFEVAREDNNYNYLRDYIGEFAFEQESLDNIYNYLKLRQTAYHNQGVEYMIVVIPNAQTAYQEYLPQYIQSAAGKTRLAQLSEYMRSKDDITFINLTDAMRAAKSSGVLYNNTEDSLNSLGQYFVYQSLYKALPENIKAGTEMVEFEDVTLYTHFTDGKTLAKTAGVSSVVKNETISLSNSMEFNYLLQELYSNIEITYADHNFGSANAGQTILLEFSNEWDKIQLMPYFSSSFDDVVYKSNHNFSLLTVDTAQPSLVIQFIHEYELSSLTNSNIAQTYHDGLTAGENPFTTSVPEVTGHVWLDDQTVCLTGLIEEGASLTVSGDAADVRTLRVGNNRFFARIEMGDLEEVVVRLQAASEDKNRSKVLKVTLTRGEQEIKPIKEITVGSDSRLFVTQNDYAILPDIGTLSVLEAELRQFSEHIQNRSSVKKTELIHVVIPQSYAVYADCAPESVQESLKMAGEHRNLMSGLYGACGWTVLDLTEPLQRERGIGKLYELTQDRWTDYGAYVGYKTLMTYIRKSYPQITPMSLDSYARVSQITAGGELAAMLGFDAATTTETNVHLLVNTPEVSYVQSGAGELDLKSAFTTMVENSALPIAVVLRDEAGTEMLESMAKHFRIMIVLPEGETEINDQVLTLFEPDYIIRISKETTPGLYDLGNKDPE